MPGRGSALDSSDWHLLDRIETQLGRVADQLERLNDNLEDEDE